VAKRRKATKQAATPQIGWEAFAAMSREALRPAGKRAAKSLRKRDKRPAAPKGTTSVEQATSQALRLGRKQAAWIVEQRKGKLAQRARAVVSAGKGPARKKSARRIKKTVAAAKAPALQAAASRGVLVAEGDSWFDYPFYDVLHELDDALGWDVETVAHRGDSVESMAYDGGQLEDFVRAIERVVRRGQVPHAILLSGGGNDVAGDQFAMLLNHRSSPMFGLNPAIADGVLATRIRVAYTTVLSAVTTACENLLGARVPILLHGYDYPVPDGRGFLGGWGPLPGPWLEPGFREKGYDDLAERTGITRDLIDRFYAMLNEVTALPAFAHVSIVDVRGALSIDLANDRYKDWWGNEMHPTFKGFRKVADLFDAKL